MLSGRRQRMRKKSLEEGGRVPDSGAGLSTLTGLLPSSSLSIILLFAESAKNHPPSRCFAARHPLPQPVQQPKFRKFEPSPPDCSLTSTIRCCTTHNHSPHPPSPPSLRSRYRSSAYRFVFRHEGLRIILYFRLPLEKRVSRQLEEILCLEHTKYTRCGRRHIESVGRCPHRNCMPSHWSHVS